MHNLCIEVLTLMSEVLIHYWEASIKVITSHRPCLLKTNPSAVEGHSNLLKSLIFIYYLTTSYVS